MIGLALIESLPDGQPKRKSYVYSINDPRTGQPVYFGKTSMSPRYRLGQHRRDSSYDSRPLYCWWRALASDGLDPVMTVLIVCDSDLESRAMESALIGLFRLAGLPILNVNKGGDGRALEEQGFCRIHGEYAPGRGCRRCKSEANREYREANLDRYAAASRKYREANLEAERERCRKRHAANRERYAEASRKWREANRERVNETNRKWRARKRAEKLSQERARTEPTT